MLSIGKLSPNVKINILKHLTTIFYRQIARMNIRKCLPTGKLSASVRMWMSDFEVGWW